MNETAKVIVAFRLAAPPTGHIGRFEWLALPETLSIDEPHEEVTRAS